MDYRTMEFHLAVTTYVGGVSTLVNGIFLFFIIYCPPSSLGIFRSQFYVGAFASFLFAATQTWSANMLLPNGTLYVVFPARSTGTIAFLSSLAGVNLQFMMLSSNFLARYAAIRGGWLRYYLTNQTLFYSIQIIGVFVAYVPPIVLLTPSSELRAIAQTAHGQTFAFRFHSEYFFVCSYEHLTWGSLFITHSVFLMAGGFQALNLIIMLTSGVITYVHISKNTSSKKLRDVNRRLLFARSFQAGFSFIFLFMPGLVINSSMLVRVDASSIAPLLSSLMAFGTLFNPFVDIAMTPDYRKRTLSSLLKGSLVRSTIETTMSTPNKRSTRIVVVNVK